jgi:hypothetical protein
MHRSPLPGGNLEVLLLCLGTLIRAGSMNQTKSPAVFSAAPVQCGFVEVGSDDRDRRDEALSALLQGGLDVLQPVVRRRGNQGEGLTGKAGRSSVLPLRFNLPMTRHLGRAAVAVAGPLETKRTWRYPDDRSSSAALCHSLRRLADCRSSHRPRPEYGGRGATTPRGGRHGQFGIAPRGSPGRGIAPE